MEKVQVVLSSGNMVAVCSNTHDAEQLSKAVVSRQQIATEYCKKKGWPEDFTELSFEQILEIRDLPEWINAGK